MSENTRRALILAACLVGVAIVILALYTRISA
jgi:hypothetical protein